MSEEPQPVSKCRVLVSYPSVNAVPEFGACMARLLAALTREGYPWELFVVPPYVSLGEAKRMAIERFASEDSEAERLVLLDSDLVFEPEDVLTLVSADEPSAILGAPCPLPRFLWPNLRNALDPVAFESESAAADLTRALARSVDYSIVLDPSKTEHPIENGWLEAQTVGFGMVCMLRTFVQEVLAKSTSAFGDAETPMETAFCEAIRTVGGNVRVHVTTQVGRMAPFHFPGAFLERIRDHISETSAAETSEST